MSGTAEPLRPTPEVEGTDLGDEYLFYDRENDQVHVLNGTAREIFLLCDGKRCAAEIAEMFAGRYDDVDPKVARADAATILDRLVGLGLIRR